MEEKYILALLDADNLRSTKFRSCSVKSLCIILDYLKTNLKTNNGNWSLGLYYQFIEDKHIQKHSFLRGLKMFCEQYSKRKLRVSSFEKYIEKIEKKLELKYSKPTTLQLKNNSEIRAFLNAMKDVKKKYLIGTDEYFIKILHENINTRLKESTLRKYYYDN